MDEREWIARRDRAFGLLLTGARDIRAALEELQPPDDSPMGRFRQTITRALDNYEAGATAASEEADGTNAG